ncbi:hypothetical protein AB4510_22025 [Vibrio sp. 10N.222.54.B12]|uniref:hypothetical protein n=2 Tax=Vibrionaceae TaxID=641 RepID=UPI001E62857C|nr:MULTISPECIES: hypothetical protein [Vibrio]MCC4790226.1 hypothetical protein [Vibrio splendidus]
MKLLEKKISGMLVTSQGRSQQTLIATMPMVEVGTYFTTDRLLPELRWIVDAAVNPKNAQRVEKIRTELQKVVIDRTISAPLSLTFVVVGKPVLSESSHQVSALSYDASNTYVVGNVLGLVAICKILGLKTFLFSSRLSVKEANQKSELRQRLAMEDVEIRIVFDAKQGLNPTDAVELFKQSNLFDSSLNLPHLSDGKDLLPEEPFPLKLFIDQLIQETAIESYGGANFDSKHVKVSEHYITTQYVLFKLIVGAVAGLGTQEYSKMSKDITLPDSRSLTSVLSDGYLGKIVAFLKAWLESLNEVFITSRSGYHLSPQVWQALGLTIHQLVNEGASLSDLKAAGKALGSLDYKKNATHWDDCAVMELDSKGLIYKNAASSTRLFRVGLFEYFVQVIKDMDK